MNYQQIREHNEMLKRIAELEKRVSELEAKRQTRRTNAKAQGHR